MKSRIKPMRQGACDRLCGTYAVLNAVSALSQTMTSSDKHALFRAMLYSASMKRTPPVAHFWAGLDNEGIDNLLDVATGFLKSRFEQLSYSRLRRSRSCTASDFLERLRRELDQNSVAILRVELINTKHWTVAYKIGKRRIPLIDSAGIDDLTRDQCCLARDGFRMRLFPSSVRIVRLRDEDIITEDVAAP
jgi:hypothetical protein